MAKLFLNFSVIVIMISKLIYAQDFNRLIIEKFYKDKEYSNLYLVDAKKKINPDDRGFDIDHLINFSNQKVIFQKNLRDEKYYYEFYYLKTNSSVEPILPVLIQERKEYIVILPPPQPPQSRVEYKIFFRPKDFVNLKNSNAELYAKVVDFLAYQNGIRLFSKFSFEPVLNKVSDNNEDYVINERVNSDYFFFDSTFSQNDFYFDVSFSKLTASYTPVTKSLGFSGVGLEVSSGDKMYHYLPYQSPYIKWGGSFLINFGGNEKSLKDNFFVEFGIFAKSKLNNEKLAADINSNLSPIITMGTPVINVSNGYIIEVNTGRPYEKLPFINFYFSMGSKSFQKPFFTKIENDFKTAYFGTTEYEATFAHYFSIDSKKKNKIKLALGIGGMDVFKVIYDNKDNQLGNIKLLTVGNVMPVVSLDYTFQSDNPMKEPLFGARTRFFNNRLGLEFWLKLLKTETFEWRLEDIFVSDPVGRSLKNWETKGGNFIQSRFRFTF